MPPITSAYSKSSVLNLFIFKSQAGDRHAFRHSFSSHMVETKYYIQTIQELLGNSYVITTMIYLGLSE
jgi:site-specific recombinase XerC